jgi:hypothetical protein
MSSELKRDQNDGERKPQAVELGYWIFTRRAAEQRERKELRSHPPHSETLVQYALGLFVIARTALRCPPALDRVSAREDGISYARWTRLRITWHT